jgi:hypothetical protein
LVNVDPTSTHVTKVTSPVCPQTQTAYLPTGTLAA